MSFCTAVHVASSERDALAEAARWLEEAARSDDCILAPRQREFLRCFVVNRWSSALAEVARKFAAMTLDHGRLLQRTLLRRCREEQAHSRSCALDVTLRRRLQNWGAERAERLVGVVRSAMIASVPKKLRASFLKAVVYGWCTAAPFGPPRRRCLYRCPGGADEQLHYLVCPLAEVVRAVVLDYSLAAPCMERLLLGLAGGDILRLRILLVLDLLLFAYDARRVGSLASTRQLVLARLKELRRRHPIIRERVLRSVALPIADA